MRAAPYLIALVSVLAAGAAEAPWPKALPVLNLNDPLGNAFTQEDLGRRGAVVIATAPCLSQGDAQKAWDVALRGARPNPAGPTIVLIEDMTQSWFRPMVLDRMRDGYKKDNLVRLLLDESGAIRKALGVGENATVAFAFAPGGALVAVETSGGTVERAQVLLKAASGPR